MAFIKNKTLYVFDDSNNYVPFETVNGEIFLTADLISGLFSFDDYKRAVKSRISKRVVRLYLLNDDETIKKDVSEYLISGSIDFNYQQGQTRSCNITLMNFKNEWLPSPVKGMLWKGTKFRIDIGLYFNGIVYWKKCGIFTPSDSSLSNNGSNKTISLQMYDKFAMLDGTLGGKTDSDFKIPVNTTIRQAIQMCLSADKGNGKSYDYKTLIFPSKHDSVMTPYTISHTPNSSTGDIIIELANMISCDAYYNETGNLTLTSGIDDTDIENKSILWNYSGNELLYFDPNMTVDYSRIVNKVIVNGGIVNGYRFKGVVINTNPKSQNNIFFTEPNSEIIDDENIISDELCLERAKFEYKKLSMFGAQIKYKSIFIPHLLPNDIILWSNNDYNIKNEKFIIQSINIDLTSEATMDISASNISEVAFGG